MKHDEELHALNDIAAHRAVADRLRGRLNALVEQYFLPENTEQDKQQIFGDAINLLAKIEETGQ